MRTTNSQLLVLASVVCESNGQNATANNLRIIARETDALVNAANNVIGYLCGTCRETDLAMADVLIAALAPFEGR